jgi:hypothetical protein
MKIIIFAVIVTAFSFGFIISSKGNSTIATAEFTFASERELFVGEEITYVVKYTLLKLGEIKLKVLSKKVVNGKNVYSTIAFMDSYNGIPFVGLHQQYESKINSNFFSDYFRGINKSPEMTVFSDYFFDYSKWHVRVKRGKINPYQLWVDTTGKVENQLQDGLSLFYYARVNVGQKNKSEIVPCFVNEKKVTTRINYYDKVQSVTIDAVDYPVATYRLDGETNFVSVYGLTGYFEGWFSKDDARIPIVAKMNVIIGRVTLELIHWKRPGWNPPKY